MDKSSSVISAILEGGTLIFGILFIAYYFLRLCGF